jgi:hypothetical protein
MSATCCHTNHCVLQCVDFSGQAGSDCLVSVTVEVHRYATPKQHPTFLMHRRSNLPPGNWSQGPASQVAWQVTLSSQTTCISSLIHTMLGKKGLSFITNRQRQNEGTLWASELAGIEPSPPAPKGAGYVSLDHSATGGHAWTQFIVF